DETGSRVAVPIWVAYMGKVLGESPREDFPVPDKVVLVPVDLDPSNECVRVVTMAFVRGTEPLACGRRPPPTPLPPPASPLPEPPQAPPLPPALPGTPQAVPLPTTTSPIAMPPNTVPSAAMPPPALPRDAVPMSPGVAAPAPA